MTKPGEAYEDLALVRCGGPLGLLNDLEHADRRQDGAGFGFLTASGVERGGALRHRRSLVTHALDQVRGAWRLPIPERDEDIAGLGHLVIAAHTGGLPKALPVGLEALPGDLFTPGPTLPQRVGAPGATREDLRDAVAVRRQHLTEALIVGERA